ncbi:MAG: urea carboxylase-associated family protein [Chloroflexi bacterium]|nr:urea carboxylase-associated family protein [Chloroflexota bacterium]
MADVSAQQAGAVGAQATAPELDLVVPASHGRAFEVRAGQLLTIEDVEGQQIGDFVAFNAVDFTEFLSTGHTRSWNTSVYLKLGHTIRTNRRNPMFEVVADTVGVHDILCPPCDPQRYLLHYNVTGHRNCLDNLTEALAPYRIASWRIPNPINVFMNVPVDAEGRFQVVSAVSKAGDRLVLRALMDVVAAISACPQDINPANGHRITDLRIVVSNSI